MTRKRKPTRKGCRGGAVGASRCRSGPRGGGQVLVVVLLAMTLLVALIFYVYNIGDQVNRRLALQNAADATAVSGGGWMARSMNVVAANNVAQTRLMALALVLDSLPLAAEMTIAEETSKDSLPDCLRKQIARGLPNTYLERDDFFGRGLREIYRQMNPDPGPDDATHLDFLETIDESLDQKNERSIEDTEKSFDVAEATEWTPGGSGGAEPEGTIWQAIVALDEFSQAETESAGEIAQRNAIRFGKANGIEGAFLTPILPVMPAYRGTFMDFEPIFTDRLRITETGASLQRSRLVSRLRASDDVLKDIEGIRVHGGAIPDWAWHYRLGPFAQCYYWRDYFHQSEGQWWEDDYSRWRIGYGTYGPLENAIRTILHRFGLMGSHGGLAFTSRMPFHLRRIATLKLAYAFGLAYPQEIQYANPWITDFDKAEEFVKEGVDRDNSDGAGMTTTGEWKTSPNTNGHDGTSVESKMPNATATFTQDLPAAGGYKVEVWWSGARDRDQDEKAQFTIKHRNGVDTVEKNQTNDYGKWVSLGTYDYLKGPAAVVLTRGEGGPTVADAVRFVPVSTPKNRRAAEARDNEQVVLRTRFYHVGVTSSVRWTHADWLNNLQATYKLEPEQQIRFHSWQLRDHDGGKDTTVGDPTRQPLWEWSYEPNGYVAKPGNSHVTKVSDHVWKGTWTNYRVIQYQHFGWPPRPIYDDKGNIIGYNYYTLHHAAWYTWGGIEIRDPVVISDPLHGVAISDRPAPILLDTSTGDYVPEHDEEFRRDRFTYLGAARDRTRGAVWPTRFVHANPLNSMVALAQSEVFNPKSFGLWTQEWRVQLVPLTQWDDWCTRIQQGMGDVDSAMGLVGEDEVDDVLQYMLSLPQSVAEEFRSQ